MSICVCFKGGLCRQAVLNAGRKYYIYLKWLLQLPRLYIHKKEEEGALVEVNNNAEQVKDITNKFEEDGQRWEENKADYTH